MPFALTLSLIACGGPLEEELDEPVSQTPGAVVRLTASRAQPRWRRGFSIPSTNTLFFAADLSACRRRVVFEVMEPAGTTWQRTEARCDSMPRVFASMPVAGTWIQQFSMTGSWKVKVYVDDAREPSGAASFQLR